MAGLVKPGGHLIALVYPIDGGRTGGPPYSVSVEAYDESLGEEWNKVLEKAPTKLTEGHEGRVKLLVWKRK